MRAWCRMSQMIVVHIASRLTRCPHFSSLLFVSIFYSLPCTLWSFYLQHSLVILVNLMGWGSVSCAFEDNAVSSLPQARKDHISCLPLGIISIWCTLTLHQIKSWMYELCMWEPSPWMHVQTSRLLVQGSFSLISPCWSPCKAFALHWAWKEFFLP